MSSRKDAGRNEPASFLYRIVPLVCASPLSRSVNPFHDGCSAEFKGSTLKAFLNAASGNAEAAREAIAAAGFELEAVQPKELENRLKESDR